MSLKKKAIRGVIWTFAQQFSVQIINFVVQIILARLLVPEDFGLVAMLSIFISLGNMLMEGGMTTSLIRTKNPDQLDYSTVFFVNVLVSLFIYVLFFLFSSSIGAFFGYPILSVMIKLYALTFVIRSFAAVHVVKLTKEMDFKTQMKLQIPSTLIGAVVGVVMAKHGYGVWSLVWMSLVQVFVFTVQNWLFLAWKPTLQFSYERLKFHFDFGYKMTVSGVLDTIYTNLYTIVIGKFFSPAIVGYYNQAETMRLFPVNQISAAMGKVTYSLFSNLSNDEQLKSAYKTVMKSVLFVVIPIMLFLVIISEELFFILFGEKWLPAVPYFQILAIASIVRPVSLYNLNVLKVKGRSDLFLKVEVYKKVIGVIAMAVSLPFGIMPLVYSLTIVSYLFTWINMSFAGKLINYSTFEQVSDIYKLFFFGIVSALLAYFFKLFLLENEMLKVVVILIAGLFFVSIYCMQVFFLDKKMISTLKKLKN